MQAETPRKQTRSAPFYEALVGQTIKAVTYEEDFTDHTTQPAGEGNGSIIRIDVTCRRLVIETEEGTKVGLEYPYNNPNYPEFHSALIEYDVQPKQ